MFSSDQIRQYIQIALDEAKKASEEGNYPIGSLIVNVNGNIESRDRNQCSTNADVTAHSEILGIRKLGSKVNKDTLGEYYLFSSLEPCFGCSFFIARTNIKYIISALKDPHKGGTSDLHTLGQFKHFFKHIELTNEPFEDLKEQSRQLMINYFLKLGRKDAAKFYETRN
ncbi:nucleoside deaminase [Candidatus Gottesmanbacteria bacterium]|nr:nucleoside deaminase [Candidatus Gottesmanbacteria bacterium]